MILRTADGRRRLAAEDFPLALLPPAPAGADAGESRDPAGDTDAAEPRLLPYGELAGATAPSGPVAWVGLDDGEPFLQPVPGSGCPLRINGLEVTASRWLRSGDTVALAWPSDAGGRDDGGGDAGGLEVERLGAGDELTLRLLAGTPPPPGWEPRPAPPPPALPSSSPTIEPRAFRPRRLQEPPRRRGLGMLVAGIVVGLLLAAGGWIVLERLEVGSLGEKKSSSREDNGTGEWKKAEEERDGDETGAPRSDAGEPGDDPPHGDEPDSGPMSGDPAGAVSEPTVSQPPLSEPPPAPLAGSRVPFRLDSEPAGATVTVDGEYRGVTPLELELPTGAPVPLELTRAGYLPLQHTLSLEEDSEDGEMRGTTLVLTPETGRVTVTLDPADTRLLVDGEERAAGEGGDPGRRSLELTTEPHTLRAEKAGYEPFETVVLPLPGETQERRIALEPLTAAALTGAREAARETAPDRLEGVEGHVLVRVEPGRFTMGASRREPGRRANEVLREVELTHAFYLAATEVTNQQLRRFDPAHRSGAVAGHNLEIDHHPAVSVSWEQAAAYCNWLSTREGLPPAYRRSGGTLVPVSPPTTGYRLPTEAEWSRAARFGPGGEGPRKYPWGSSLPVPAGAGNFGDASATALLPTALPGYRDGYPVTAPPDAFGPDARGLHQIGGNVAEWVQDLYAIRPPGAPGAPGSVAVDPTGPSSGDLHVIRGASWRTGNVTELRLTYRDYDSEPRPDVGFRVARFLTPPATSPSPATAPTSSPQHTAGDSTP